MELTELLPLLQKYRVTSYKTREIDLTLLPSLPSEAPVGMDGLPKTPDFTLPDDVEPTSEGWANILAAMKPAPEAD